MLLVHCVRVLLEVTELVISVIILTMILMIAMRPSMMIPIAILMPVPGTLLIHITDPPCRVLRD